EVDLRNVGLGPAIDVAIFAWAEPIPVDVDDDYGEKYGPWLQQKTSEPFSFPAPLLAPTIAIAPGETRTLILRDKRANVLTTAPPSQAMLVACCVEYVDLYDNNHAFPELVDGRPDRIFRQAR